MEVVKQTVASSTEGSFTLCLTCAKGLKQYVERRSTKSKKDYSLEIKGLKKGSHNMNVKPGCVAGHKKLISDGAHGPPSLPVEGSNLISEIIDFKVKN